MKTIDELEKRVKILGEQVENHYQERLANLARLKNIEKTYDRLLKEKALRKQRGEKEPESDQLYPQWMSDLMS